MARVYLPTTVDGVRELAERGSVRVHVGFMVTPEASALAPDADEEELEYYAMLDAATVSAELVATRRVSPALRVVLAADVPRATLTEPSAKDLADLAELAADLHAGAIALRLDIPFGDLAALHVDESSDGLPESRDLLWYAPLELGDWLAELDKN